MRKVKKKKKKKNKMDLEQEIVDKMGLEEETGHVFKLRVARVTERKR